MQAPFKIAMFYFVFGALWILLSDTLINVVFLDATQRAVSQTVKGWFYVAVTTGFLYALVRYYFQQVERKEVEKRAVFQSTMRAVHHILNNFLNNMILLRLEAEESDAFDEDALAQYDHVIQGTADQVKALSSIEQIDTQTIEAHIKPEPHA